MGSFITGTELSVIRDEENWDEFESCTIREYSQGAKDVMDLELIEVAGRVGEVPQIVQRAALVPVRAAGIESWTLRELSEADTLRLYANQAQKLDKEVEALSTSEKCEAVKDVPIVAVTREWMGKLKHDYASYIAFKIRQLNRGRTSAEEREFLREIRRGDQEQDESAG